MSSNPSNPNATDSISSDGKGGPPSLSSQSLPGQSREEPAISAPSKKGRKSASSRKQQSKKQTQGPATPRSDPSPPPEDHCMCPCLPFSLSFFPLITITLSLRDSTKASRLSNVRDQPQQHTPTQPRFTAHLQQPLLPGPPAYPILTPGYPMPGHPHPYGTPSPYAHPGTPVNGQATHAAIPQYSYAVHHAAYSQYPPYPQYPPAPGMMMYNAPGPSQPEPPRVDASSPAASTTGKRKRK